MSQSRRVVASSKLTNWYVDDTTLFSAFTHKVNFAGIVGLQPILPAHLLGTSVPTSNIIYDGCEQQPHGRFIRFHVQRTGNLSVRDRTAFQIQYPERCVTFY
jgi:hypothetical protein